MNPYSPADRQISPQDQLVSVVITTRNSARTLEACLESVRRQRYSALEVIIVDNASRDSTLAIAQRYADAVLNRGPERSAQRNAGLQHAHGEYVFFLDSDMTLSPDVVSSAVKKMQEGVRAVIVPEVSIGDGFWAHCKAVERSCYKNDPNVCAARFFRSSEVRDLGGYDERLTGPEDWDLSMRVARSGEATFVDATIRHDEGRQTLRDLYLKKYYYGRTINVFVEKHGAAALKKLAPLRPSLVRNVHRIFRNPALGAGLVFMKAVELAGITVGMLMSKSNLSSTPYEARS